MRSFVAKRVLLGVALVVGVLAVNLSITAGVLSLAPVAAQEAVDALPTPAPLPTGTPPAGSPLSVAATTGIVADLVAQVGGPRVAVQSILPPNADPHDFEPAPEDIVKVAAAEMVFRHGLGLDNWSDQLIANAGPDLPVVVVSDGIPTIASDDDEFSQGDPHIWFDPERTAMMIATIEAALTEIDPEGGATYRARAAAYTVDLTELDRAIQAAMDAIPAERRKVVTNHDALAYYGERYGLTIVGTVIPGLDTAAEPSAREIGALIELMQEEGVTVILAENTTSPDLAAELATQAGVTIVDDLYTDSLGDPSSGADTYLGLMRTDTALIVDALA